MFVETCRFRAATRGLSTVEGRPRVASRRVRGGHTWPLDGGGGDIAYDRVGENGSVPDSNTSLATTAPHADLAWGRTGPNLEVFTELALEHRRVIPVVRRVLADAETPVGVYRKPATDAPATFPLESAEHGGVWSRYSSRKVPGASVASLR